MLGVACQVGQVPTWFGTDQDNQGCKRSLMGLNKSVGGSSSVGGGEPGSVPKLTVVAPLGALGMAFEFESGAGIGFVFGTGEEPQSLVVGHKVGCAACQGKKSWGVVGTVFDHGTPG